MHEKITQAIAQFTRLNQDDPRLLTPSKEEDSEQKEMAKEVLFAQRLARWVHKLSPQPSSALQLAAHCQHLQRWTMPRVDFPAGRVGYLKWRKDLAKMHAALAQKVLTTLHFSEKLIQEVQAINLKQDLHGNPDVQLMEDALCLSFLEYEFIDFCDKQVDDEKVINIVRKTWGKMSDNAHQVALSLPMRGRPQTLIAQALAP